MRVGPVGFAFSELPVKHVAVARLRLSTLAMRALNIIICTLGVLLLTDHLEQLAEEF